MKTIFQSCAVLSIGLFAGIGAALATPAAHSPYYGRWTVNEERPTFTVRGRQYKTIDIAPCGNDFCGTSVADGGQCGPVLFRFLSSHSDGTTTLRGHAAWGRERKNVVINTWSSEGWPGGRVIELYVGDGYDFGERSDNMPRFHAQYRRTGQASCRRR